MPAFSKAIKFNLKSHRIGVIYINDGHRQKVKFHRNASSNFLSDTCEWIEDRSYFYTLIS